MSKSQDPISELTDKFRDSLVERGMNRYRDCEIQQQTPNAWLVEGSDSFNDSYADYRVQLDSGEGKYSCSCFDHAWGDSREKNICSHIMAVIITRRLNKVQESIQSDSKPADGVVEELVDQVWPHPDYRNNQQEVIIDCLETLYEEDQDYYCVSAPTGFGKSPVCFTLSRLMGMIARYWEDSLAETADKIFAENLHDKQMEDGYYVTPQNILLDQLEEDYGQEESFGMLKGRSHYSCSHAEGDETCADGPCRYNKDLNCDGYGKAKKKALSSPVANTNFVMYMIHPQIQHRPGLVVDEAHMMPEYVMGTVSVELREDQLNEWDWNVPEFDEYQQYVDWFNPKLNEMNLWLDKAKQQLERDSKKQWSKQQKKLAAKIDRTERLYRKMSNLVRDWRDHQEQWVVQHEQFTDNRSGERLEKVTFRPITPYRFMDDLVFSKANKTVISSATPPQSDLLGVDEEQVTVEEIPSDFPVDNRPIYFESIGKMSSSNRNENAQKAALKIRDLAVGKTLVHCHTYDFASELESWLTAIGVEKENIITQRRGTGKSRESYVEDFKEGDAQFYLSVNMYDGVDLNDDYCRTNIMCVVPFPYLGDPQVQKRKEKEGDRFFNWQTAMRIMQAYGRSTRSKEDWSNFYILDSNFGWFYKQNKQLFFDWFKEGMQW